MASDTEKIQANRPSQERIWVIERVGWTAMALLIAVGALGVFARGPLSSAKAVSLDGRLTVEFERFMRSQAPSELKIFFVPKTSTSIIHIAASLVDGLGIQSVRPHPIRSIAVPDGMDIEVAGQPSGLPVEVVLDVEPAKLWSVAGTVSLRQGPAVVVSSFVYP